MLLCDFGESELTLNKRVNNNTNKVIDLGSSRPAAAVFSEVKLLFLSMESGDFKETIITAVYCNHEVTMLLERQSEHDSG